ncbi:hypothetical protein DEU34_2281 [Microbacterium sp. AG1240]|uniref:hypothetical protein n=1 Tax=Microbacterium sp. AG1240 TaxID=2183992 RepID=UPI000EABEDA0|nr:hypothetical protein [Microbacterium sp. AG1240]RKT33677.1 hypothetical protein DEU34_2281 [Microbacterium sp. AG1240]
MLLLVIFLGLAALAVFGLIGFFVLGSTSRARRKAEESADTLLDEAFDGRPSVTYKVNMTTMKYETIVSGAEARGYRLEHQADNQYGPHTLMFRKA